jgi:DHA1 family tetracycline resistance protein-like MFS transporter
VWTPRTSSNKAVFFVLVTVFLDVVGVGLIVPVTPSLLAEVSGKTLGEAAAYGGWLVGVFAFLQFMASPIVGNLSDAYGRRVVLLVTLFLYAVSYLLMGLAHSILWLFIARSISGITSATNSVANAYIADISAPGERARRFGLLGAGFSAGWIIGPALGGVLGAYGPRVPFYASGLLALANCVYGFFFLPETLKRELRRPFEWFSANPLGTALKMRKFTLVLDLIVGMLVLLTANAALPVIWPYYTMEQFHWSSMQVGLSVAVFGVLNVLVQTLVLRRLLAHTDERHVLYFSLVNVVISYLGFAFAPVGWVALIAILCWAFSNLSNPILTALLSEQVPADQQGALQGALGSARSLATVVTPIVMTALFSAFTRPGAPVHFPGAPYLASALLGIVGSLVLVRALRPTASVRPGEEAAVPASPSTTKSQSGNAI